MMRTIPVHKQVRNRKIEIELPEELDNANIEGVLVLHVTKAPEVNGWPAGYFEQTFGALHDVEDFERPPQGEYEIREDFE